MTGRIHSIQSLGTVDGPGVRAVVFMQGCPLRCPYCHNPDTWDFAQGEPAQAQEIAQRVLRYRGYFGKSGGVTVSGGEPLAQAGFVSALFAALKAQGVHTALDTSGCLWSDDVQALLEQTDLVLLDIKAADDKSARARFSLPLEVPLSFLRRCEERGVPVWIRHVVVPGWNDSREELEALAGLLSGVSCVQRVELLPFRKFCVEKYDKMGIAFPLNGYAQGDDAAIAAAQERYFAPWNNKK
ncbi:MAG: pyruvate formate-lyase-activating protein [Eubacteriales bacterium]|nr:pyruvate formate-lyase-activating protein [Eubacteriales bacterium]